MRYEFRQPAAQHERFAAGAFNRSIGSVIPIRVEGREVGEGRVVEAVVDADGSGVTFTYEVLAVRQLGDK
jgi:hypothetical protein